MAELSLEMREFVPAYKKAKDAQLSYALEVKGELGRIGYYVKNYPKEISVSVLALLLFSFGTFRITKLQMIKKKIKNLKKEEKVIGQLIEIIQRECFEEKKMSMEEYNAVMKTYQEKLSKIIEMLIEYENKRIHALKFTSKNNKMIRERENIINLIKELQEDYLKGGTVETRTYELKLDSFNKRLTDIDEKMAMLEVKRAFKNWFGLKRLFKKSDSKLKGKGVLE